MKHPIHASMAFAAILGASLLGGCGHGGLSLEPGKTCTIQFRRDALGTASALPVSPFTESINGAVTCVSGTFKRTAGHWIVIEQNGTEVWIPESVVLAITQ